jgi:hypothetical protein
MKKMNTLFLATACFLLMTFSIKAQTFSEWFRQNKTQIKYLINQITAYAVFRNDLAAGYQIAWSGLTYISDATCQEHDLHSDYFSSLHQVSPAVAGYSGLRDIFNYQLEILACFKKILLIPNMSHSDKDFITRVNHRIILKCGQSINELGDVLTDNVLAMKDNERISRIDAIRADMKDICAFTQSFSSGARLLVAQQQSAVSDATESKINNGLN